MPYLDFDYKPSDLDEECFLSEVPLQLLKNAIKTQFADPLEFRKTDYVQTFITKYDYSKENETEDDEEELEEHRSDFVSFMNHIFEQYLQIAFPEIESLSDDDAHELLHLTYRFFIKNIKKNFVTLIMNYMDEYKQEIISGLPKKKDVTSINFKVEIDNDDDVAIISNLDQVIDDILSVDMDIDTFMNYCSDTGLCLETQFVKEKIDNFEITGNFVPKYVAMLDESFRIEIQSKIRNKILKKYPNRKKELPPEEIGEESSEEVQETNE